MPNQQNLKPFQKSISGNPKGRPKGKKPVKPIIEKLLEKTLPAIEKEMKSNPVARIDFYKDLTRIVLTVNK